MCNINGRGLLLETKKDLAVGGFIKLNLYNRSWQRYREGYVRLLCVLGSDDLYIKAKVVRACNSKVNERRRFGIEVKNVLFKWKFLTPKKILNERKEERKKGREENYRERSIRTNRIWCRTGAGKCNSQIWKVLPIIDPP